jgi:CBS domain-containing protein
MVLRAVLLLLVVKGVIWAVALGSGTSGGVLAPLLIIGGALGALEGRLLPGQPGLWALVSMAAMMGGTMRSPLTATLFAVELTGNMQVLLPALVACLAAHTLTVLLLRRSILTEKIARRGHHVIREYSIDPFELTRVSDVMISAVDTLSAALSIDGTVDFFTSGEPRHKSYPVIDEAGRVIGMCGRADILRWTMEGQHRETVLADIMSPATLLAGYADELVGHLADRMAAADIGRIPIVERANHRLVGIVARKDLLNVRATALAQERDRAIFRARGRSRR